MKACKYGLMVVLLSIFNGCGDSFLNVLPEDSITSETFWETEEDVKSAINGIYPVLKERSMYGHGPKMDAITPNAYQWNGTEEQIGRGTIDAGTGGMVSARWTNCYKIISRANRFLENIENVESLNEKTRMAYIGEAYFLRGIAYSLLADTYGRAPIITSIIGVEEARELSQSSTEETWNRAIADFDVAIENLPVDASQKGRATKGAALGMKMRAYLYQNKYPEVLTVVEQIEELGKYALFSSYRGLFLEENENNQEVMFDLQNMSGDFDQGMPRLGWELPGLKNAPTAGWAVPTQDLVDAYEMAAEGTQLTPENPRVPSEGPYQGRDARLYFSVILPGTYVGDYLFNDDAQNHVGQPIKNFAMRKYEDVMANGERPILGKEALNFIVLRYASVILAKAEALIETNQNIDEAISLINRIRTERDDVTVSPLSLGLSQAEARESLRHERRIEFALEGLYWSDIRRWEIGPDIYPMEIRGSDGGLVETRYEGGYEIPKDLVFPIPDNEISLNSNLTQNTGW
ncbi:RagB/SusD domain-containing protein [Fodinibius roseus]|uniref:RagB/SusD domain-containing protein n=1 Tax=Fodinibius roseus TaxID=1194090 RepID=A0A1M5LB20_9BACT|nr:RagB/SusD family nutrient uptake outer membrane protein [Fodinibius roseus]SHG62170.1 RagB/SusD domain-containing protein [Fodinibius roseus]